VGWGPGLFFFPTVHLRWTPKVWVIPRSQSWTWFEGSGEATTGGCLLSESCDGTPLCRSLCMVLFSPPNPPPIIPSCSCGCRRDSRHRPMVLLQSPPRASHPGALEPGCHYHCVTDRHRPLTETAGTEVRRTGGVPITACGKAVSLAVFGTKLTRLRQSNSCRGLDRCRHRFHRGHT